MPVEERGLRRAWWMPNYGPGLKLAPPRPAAGARASVRACAARRLANRLRLFPEPGPVAWNRGALHDYREPRRIKLPGDPRRRGGRKR